MLCFALIRYKDLLDLNSVDLCWGGCHIGDEITHFLSFQFLNTFSPSKILFFEYLKKKTFPLCNITIPTLLDCNSISLGKEAVGSTVGVRTSLP